MLRNPYLSFIASLLFLGQASAPLAAPLTPPGTNDSTTLQSPITAPKTYFLIMGKPKVTDPPQQQERAIEGVRKIAEAAGGLRPGVVIDALADGIITKEQFRQGLAREKVTGTIFQDRLRKLADKATSQDTVFIYTHSHGRKDGFEKSQPLGGIVMDLPVRQPEHGGTLLWDDYVELLLRIPARNVVVLTMSCFSGGFVEYLNSPAIRKRWADRSQKEGRNFIVLTSQNKDLSSDPIVKDGELINPFTYAVAKALSGEADGFELVAGKPTTSVRSKDGKLTAGEMIDFILYTTEHAISENPRRRNTAEPRMTGSFNRADVLLAQPSRLSSRSNPVVAHQVVEKRGEHARLAKPTFSEGH